MLSHFSIPGLRASPAGSMTDAGGRPLLMWLIAGNIVCTIVNASITALQNNWNPCNNQGLDLSSLRVTSRVFLLRTPEPATDAPPKLFSSLAGLTGTQDPPHARDVKTTPPPFPKSLGTPSTNSAFLLKRYPPFFVETVWQVRKKQGGVRPCPVLHSPVAFGRTLQHRSTTLHPAQDKAECQKIPSGSRQRLGIEV